MAPLAPNQILDEAGQPLFDETYAGGNALLDESTLPPTQPVTIPTKRAATIIRMNLGESVVDFYY